MADRGGQSALYVWLPALTAALTLVIGGYTEALPLRLVFLAIAVTSIIAFMPAFWALAYWR